MWNMAVNNISYPIYPLSTRTEKGYITKMIPFFFCSVYQQKSEYTTLVKEYGPLITRLQYEQKSEDPTFV